MVSSEDGRYDALIEEWLGKGALPSETERERRLRESADVFGWNEPDQYDRRP